jgi:hypothetical protein
MRCSRGVCPYGGRIPYGWMDEWIVGGRAGSAAVGSPQVGIQSLKKSPGGRAPQDRGQYGGGNGGSSRFAGTVRGRNRRSSRFAGTVRRRSPRSPGFAGTVRKRERRDETGDGSGNGETKAR